MPCTLKQRVVAFFATAAASTLFPYALGALPANAAPSRGGNPPTTQLSKLKAHHAAYTTPVHHVVVVVMENRTLDNLFQLFPGADTSGMGLTQQDLMAPDDPNHTYLTGFQHDFAGMWPANSLFYVNPADNYVGQVYYGLASQWVLADEVLQTNEGPSFPAHQYLIAGQSGGIANFSSSYNTAPYSMAENPGGPLCGGMLSTESYVDMNDPYPSPLSTGTPCNDYKTILDEVEAAFPVAPFTPPWRYYIAAPSSFWDAPAAVHHLAPFSSQVVTDVGGGVLQQDIAQNHLSPLTYVVPCGSWSDHPTGEPATNPQEVGPNFVNFIVNAIGTSSYWNNTTILVTWDDWGGWYDHVIPNHVPNVYGNPSDPYEYGFRVPLLMISPWLKTPGAVDHYGRTIISPSKRTQASILRYIETVFGLSTLGAADQAPYTDDLSEAFNYSRTPIPFTPVTGPAPFPAPTADCKQIGPDGI